jgi:hypothetical protein
VADSDKDILITPNRSQTADPSIVFKSGATSGDPITIAVIDDGTTSSLSFEGSAGQLFGISNSLTGSIFTVSDISGIPSLEILDDGTVKIAEYGGDTTVGGDLTAGGDVNSLSDIRTKSDIETLSNSLNIVNQLRGVSYTKDNKRSIGLIAQEVKEILPEVVHGNEIDFYSISYGNIVGLLIEAIKELKIEIEQLKNQ